MKRTRWRRAAWRLLAGGVVFVTVACSPARDLRRDLQIVDVTTGWFDAGLVDGKNKLVPTISFRLKNVSSEPIASVQINGVFRRVGEEDEWGNAFVRAIGSDGLAPGAVTAPIVLRSQLGYTSEQPRLEMLRHRQFIDARVELFGKHGSAQWIKLAEVRIERQLLTR